MSILLLPRHWQTFLDIPSFSDIIRNYNPDVRGYSIGIGEHDQPEAWLNAAQPGDGSV